MPQGMTPVGRSRYQANSRAESSASAPDAPEDSDNDHSRTNHDGSATRRSSTPNGGDGFWTLGAGVAAAVVSALYVGFVDYYAVNAPKGDEWVSVIPFVHNSLHGHLTLSALWAQEFNESHMFVPNLIFVASGRFDHLDFKAIILLSALMFVAAYGLGIVLLRRYLGRRLTWLPVASVGVVWFSLVDYENALWSFQVAWYLVIFFFLLALWFLLGRWTRHQTFVFALAIVATVAASCSAIQGFLIWPIGLLCLLWKASADGPKSYRKPAIWVLGAGLMALAYFIQYNFSAAHSGCLVSQQKCSLGYSLHHPGETASFFLALLGNLFGYEPDFAVHANSAYAWTHQIAGAVFLVVVLLALARMLRDRRRDDRIPLPMALLTFGLAFDLMVSTSRVGEGVPSALDSHLSMAQPILLAGIVIYAWGNPMPRCSDNRDAKGLTPRSRLPLATLLALVVVFQVTLSTGVGVVQGGHIRQQQVAEARVVVNLARIPKSAQGCEVDVVVWDNLFGQLQAILAALPLVKYLEQDQLSVFAPGAHRTWVTQGPPQIPGCK